MSTKPIHMNQKGLAICIAEVHPLIPTDPPLWAVKCGDMTSCCYTPEEALEAALEFRRHHDR